MNCKVGAAHGNKPHVITLDAVEVLRRFFLHVLPLARRLLAKLGSEPLPACSTATSGTARGAVKRCGARSALPPHSYTWPDSIHHDRL